MNISDRQNFSHAIYKTLPAEVLLDGISQLVQMRFLFRRAEVDSQTQLLESLLEARTCQWCFLQLLVVQLPLLLLDDVGQLVQLRTLFQREQTDFQTHLYESLLEIHIRDWLVLQLGVVRSSLLLLDGIGQPAQMRPLFRREQVESQTEFLQSPIEVRTCRWFFTKGHSALLASDTVLEEHRQPERLPMLDV